MRFLKGVTDDAQKGHLLTPDTFDSGEGGVYSNWSDEKKRFDLYFYDRS